MYEQDYIMRMNREAIKVMARLLCKKEVETLSDIEEAESKSGDKISLDSLAGQADMGDLSEAETEILQGLKQREERALERALLFYSYLNGMDEEELQEKQFGRGRIQEGLKNIAAMYGISAVVGI